MQFFKTPNINFVGSMNKAFIFSGILIVITIISIIMHKGLNPSIDFVGGTVVQLKFDKPVIEDLGKIRAIVADLNYGQPEVKTIGKPQNNEIQIIVKKKAEGTAVGDEIKSVLAQKYGENSFELRREEKVGAKIGSELGRNAFLAIVFSFIVIVIYIGIRFHLPFGIAAIVALFHDILITLGVFSITNAEISLPVIAALLTIVGYSLNDTIVVFDRIRENLTGVAAKKSFKDKVNESINQSLSRTIITSLTTFFVVLVMFLFFYNSGDVITYFLGALITGIIVGTYSSVFIASPVLIMWNKKWPIKK